MTQFLVVLMVAFATPAWVIDPAYLGVWAPSLEECKDGGRAAFLITPKAAYGREWQMRNQAGILRRRRVAGASPLRGGGHRIF